MPAIAISSWNNENSEIERGLDEMGLSFSSAQRSNLSSATITEYIIPLAGIVIPTFVSFLLAIRDKAPRTVIEIRTASETVVINLQADPAAAEKLSAALAKAGNEPQ
jgi:hypothetical protein